MSETTSQIRSWAASELKYWEQAALQKIINGIELQETDYQELVEYFKQDAGLTPTPDARPRLSFSENTSRGAQPSRCHLERIFGLRNVNALVQGQEITFAKQLTLVYGENGAGKTGYARPLGCACFARGEREVLPDVAAKNLAIRPQAEIELSYGDLKRTVTWKMGEHPGELSRFHVFDGNSVAIHLTESNALSFTPAGLSVLTQLAELTDQVRERIRALIGEHERTVDFHFLFTGDSDVKALVTSLSTKSNLDDLEILSNLTTKDATDAKSLEKEIGEIKSLNVTKRIKDLGQEIDDLENLQTSTEKALAAFGDRAEADVRQLIEAVHARRRDASESGISQFTFESFNQIGTQPWIEFVGAARFLAETERVGGVPYPEQGAPCLLCRQPLSSDAVNLIRRLWAFLESDPQKHLETAQNACQEKVADLRQHSLNYFALDSSVRRLLDRDLPVVTPAIEAQVESCIARREAMIESIATLDMQAVPPMMSVDMGDLGTLVRLRQDEIEKLLNSDIGQRLTKAENSLRRHRHREVLAKNMGELRSFIERKQWASRARQSLGSTRIITGKYDELFKKLVTQRYKTLFAETLGRFMGHARVAIETRGSKGETVRQIVLNLKDSSRAFSVEQILSDGEKRAVAISDFLTEVSLDEYNCGIVLDDPVTSLDDKWKGTLAKCLTEQAKQRQVIIFTHDLSFLYRIKASAEDLEVAVVTHWIREEDGHPGHVYLNNSPACERDFTSAKIARDHYGKAKGLEPSKEQNELEQGFGALRTSYEALVIFEVFNEVVARFEERISFGRLKDVCVDRVLVEEIITRMEALSRHIGAHSHSDKFASVKPTRADLFSEIESFEVIRNKQRELKKKRGTNGEG